MAVIRVTTDGQTIEVRGGDTVIIDIPGGGTVNIVAKPGVNIKTFRIDFGGDDDVADTVNIDRSTFTTYGLHIDIRGYDPTDTVSLLSAFGTSVDPGNEDEYNLQYIGANGATFDGYIRAKDNGEKDCTADPAPVIICFAQGTVIHTDLGPVAVESLALGDLVETRDRGVQPIRWIGKRVLDTLDLARYPQLRPVCFKAGSLGRDLPYKDLTVSPQHRMRLTGWQAELHFGETEVLAPAIGFVNDNNIFVEDYMPMVCYFHLLFDQHEIIMANGVWAESLHAGEMALASMSMEATRELNLIFPDAPSDLPKRITARAVARKGEAMAALSAA
jgi:hypothetical protein